MIIIWDKHAPTGTGFYLAFDDRTKVPRQREVKCIIEHFTTVLRCEVDVLVDDRLSSPCPRLNDDYQLTLDGVVVPGQIKTHKISQGDDKNIMFAVIEFEIDDIVII